MKCKIPEISWHNRDPVLSVDIQPKSNACSNYYRLASGGTDAHVLIWYMKLTSTGENADIELDLAADLTRHQRAVNVVKWSPNGELLASGDDESVVFIWKQKTDGEPPNILDPSNENDKEVWMTLKVLRGHMEDIYDLSWAPNSLFLVSASVDNSAMIWDVHKGKAVSILNDHKGFVQGVTWDPKNQYIATLSTDRYLRIFDIQTKKVLYRISKGTLPFSSDSNLHGKRMRLFHDDTLQTFFRRLSFTPDGKLLLTPAGVTDYDDCTSPLNTTYIFSRYSFRQPAIVLPCPDQYTVAVRCCPLLYKLRPHNVEKNPPVVPLPYRMIFAVATKSSVYFYDTQQKQPFALISNIHYTRLTDITWSNDGRIVVVSSTDGFCSLITFEQGELGEEYENSEAALEAALAQVIKSTNKQTTKKQKDADGVAKSRKPSTDETAALQKENANVRKEPQFETVPEQKKEETENQESVQLKSDSILTENAEVAAKEEENEDVQIKKPVAEEPVAITNQKLFDCAKPIAVKRKPGPVTGVTNNITEAKKATPIAIKRKPGPILNNEEKNSFTTSKEEATLPKMTSAIIPSKVLAADIIIDKEILSSDEKFESPEKKCRPATPITIRRHPRTPKSLTNTPTSMANILKSPADSGGNSPLSSLSTDNVTPVQDKRAKPIAIRKAPRAIITTPTVVNTTSLVEEAMDAWPLYKELNKEVPKESGKSIKEPGITPLPVSETTCEHTEDIRLVYEETNEELPVKEAAAEAVILPETAADIAEKTPANTPRQQTPNGSKTPRRVALKTISTPKSKKKLLD